MKWQLWEKKTFVVSDKGKKFLFQTDFAFINPAGIINEHRVTNPYGCLPFKNLYERDNGFWLWDITGETIEFLKQYEGWRKAKHRMTDEQLAKGWLLP